MAEPVRTYDPEASSAASDPPRLRPVADAVGSDELRPPRIGRSGAIGYALGFVVGTAIFALAGTLVGLSVPAAIGLGAFVGVWGGGGFGFMMAATVPYALYLDAQEAASRQGPAHPDDSARPETARRHDRNDKENQHDPAAR